MAISAPAPTTSPPALVALLEQLRGAVEGLKDPAETADRVAAAMTAGTPGLAVITAAHRHADSDRLTSHLVHAERRFSVVAMVVPPDQQTTIHDHLAWCVVTVLRGTEHETLYRYHRDHLTPAGQSTNPAGAVTAFAPPGDIHRVRNETDTTAISLHVYGADLRRTGSSVRRSYDLPIRDHTQNQENR